MPALVLLSIGYSATELLTQLLAVGEMWMMVLFVYHCSTHYIANPTIMDTIKGDTVLSRLSSTAPGYVCQVMARCKWPPSGPKTFGEKIVGDTRESARCWLTCSPLAKVP